MTLKWQIELTFVDLVILLIDLCFQNVALNEPFHDLLWEQVWHDRGGEMNENRLEQLRLHGILKISDVAAILPDSVWAG